MNPQTSQVPTPSGERPNPNANEYLKPAVEQGAAPVPASPNPGQPPAGAPPLTAKDVAAAIAQMPAGTNPPPPVVGAPATAADQDVIEPEWVDKAEAVITQTAGDPHAEEEAVEALQIDYLDKRYGHKVKKPDQGQAG